MSKSRQNSNVPNRLSVADRTELLTKTGTREGEVILQRDIGLLYAWTDTQGTDNSGTILNVGTGSWLAQYLGAVNIKWFGATGDGVTDDTIAIQAALSASRSIFMPNGSYLLTQKLSITATSPALDGINITGESKGLTSLIFNGVSGLEISGRGVKVSNLSISNTGVVGAYGINLLDGATFITVDDVNIDGFTTSFHGSKTLYISLSNMQLTNAVDGIVFDGSVGSWNVDWFNNQILLTGIKSTGHSGTGVKLLAVGVVIDSLDVSTCSVGIDITGQSTLQECKSISIDGFYSEVTDTPIKTSFARINIIGAFMLGKASGSEDSYPIVIDDSSIIEAGNIRTQDFWLSSANVLNGSKLTFVNPWYDETVTVDSTSNVNNLETIHGTTTVTLLDVAVSQNFDIEYSKTGDLVELNIPAVSDTSNNARFLARFLDAAIRPATDTDVPCIFIDNGVTIAGVLKIEPDGEMYGTLADGTAFTATGIKGFPRTTLRYYIS